MARLDPIRRDRPTPSSGVVLTDPARRVARHARDVFHQQSLAVAELAGRVDHRFERAVSILLDTRGHVVVTGVGKSGLIGRKISATLASTGTPSFFMHAAEASHGDLGAITANEAVILISYSGETEEVLRILPALRARRVPTIALTGKPESTLGQAADVTLDCSVEREACPLNLAPTTSTLCTMAMGDALAVSLMHIRNFDVEDFARRHPGGNLGHELTTSVREVMRTGDLPTVLPGESLGHAMWAAMRGRLGCALVVDEARKPRGAVGESEIRDAIDRWGEAAMTMPIERFMTQGPPAVAAHALLAQARILGAEFSSPILLVVDDLGRLTGVVSLNGD